MKPALYQKIADAPAYFPLRKAQQDIIDNWTTPHWLFSVTQIACRNGLSRGSVKRQIVQLEEMRIVRKVYNAR